MRNYKTASFISSFIFIVFFGIVALVDPDLSGYAFPVLIIFNLFINLPILIWASKKYGKEFKSDEINNVPEINNFLS
ncbi:MAG: hypothetical protein WCG97_03165 [bacterium]